MVMMYVVSATLSNHYFTDARSNKWVLNVTTAPLFFLFAQFIIAIVLFCLFHAFKVITLPMMHVDVRIIKGLASTVILNLLALRYIFRILSSTR